jgi:metal-sulfur cluster biosynthetic enzyme
VSERGAPALVDEIHRVLDEIQDPCSVATSVPMGLGEMGIVKSVEVADDGHVEVELRLTSPFCEMINYMRIEAIRKVGELPGVTAVSVCHDSGLDWDHDMIAPDAQARRQRRLLTLKRLAERQRSSTAGA